MARSRAVGRTLSTETLAARAQARQEARKVRPSAEEQAQVSTLHPRGQALYLNYRIAAYDHDKAFRLAAEGNRAAGA